MSTALTAVAGPEMVRPVFWSRVRNYQRLGGIRCRCRTRSCPGWTSTQSVDLGRRHASRRRAAPARCTGESGQITVAARKPHRCYGFRKRDRRRLTRSALCSDPGSGCKDRRRKCWLHGSRGGVTTRGDLPQTDRRCISWPTGEHAPACQSPGPCEVFRPSMKEIVRCAARFNLAN
jgi:hypothetical protein